MNPSCLVPREQPVFKAKMALVRADLSLSPSLLQTTGNPSSPYPNWTHLSLIVIQGFLTWSEVGVCGKALGKSHTGERKGKLPCKVTCDSVPEPEVGLHRD